MSWDGADNDWKVLLESIDPETWDSVLLPQRIWFNDERNYHRRTPQADQPGGHPGAFTPDQPPEFEDGLCREHDPDMFFPNKGEANKGARQVCGRCDIRELCLEWALEHNQRWGIWGGTTEAQRRRIKRERRAAA